MSKTKKKQARYPTAHPRQGWDEQFRAMAERGDGRLLDVPVPTRWDEEEWKEWRGLTEE